MTNPVFFHEDAYCQVELLPINNLLIKRNKTNSDRNHREQNLTDDGFLNISTRSSIKYPLSSINIDYKEFEVILKESSLFFFDKVYTGYSTERILKNSIHGFGFENYILYYEFNNDIITQCWIDYNLFSDTLNCYPERLQNALFKLGTIYDLILIDWNELLTVVLKNEPDLANYIKEAL